MLRNAWDTLKLVTELAFYLFAVWGGIVVFSLWVTAVVTGVR